MRWSVGGGRHVKIEIDDVFVSAVGVGAHRGRGAARGGEHKPRAVGEGDAREAVKRAVDRPRAAAGDARVGPAAYAHL